MDFRALFRNNRKPAKRTLRAFRHEIVNLVESIEGVALNKEQSETGGNYFKVALAYPQMADLSPTLRPCLRLDFSYTQIQNNPEECYISSFVSEFSGDSPEIKVLCLSPLETAAEKFSALLWRVNKRNRDDELDDPAMIRHLYDLYSLRDHINPQNKEFWAMMHTSYETDQQKPKRSTGVTLPKAINQMLAKLSQDNTYKNEYEQFVMRMSYEKVPNLASFDDAIEFLTTLSERNWGKA